MTEFVKLSVLLEAEGKIIHLQVHPADAERAQIDEQFLQMLINQATPLEPIPIPTVRGSQAPPLQVSQAPPVRMPQASPVWMPQASPVRMPQASPVWMPQAPPVRMPQASPVRMPQASPVRMPQASPKRVSQAPPARVPQVPLVQVSQTPPLPVLQAPPVQPQSSSASQEFEAAKDSQLFIWSSSCIDLLLSLYEEHQAEFTDGTKRHYKIWNSISVKMSDHGYKVSGTQCRSKLNGLRKTYKNILDHNNSSGNDRKTWPYFDRMHEVFGSSGWAQPVALATEQGPSSPHNQTKSSPKKRKFNLLEKMNKKIEERQKERESRKQEWQNLKAQKIDELILLKQQQHREKMEMMKALIENFRK